VGRGAIRFLLTRLRANGRQNVVWHFTGDERIQIDAAQGWLGLGNWHEANQELDRIPPRLRAHPHVLKMRYAVYAKAERWELALEIARTLSMELPHNSFGFVYAAHALHRLNRTQEAYKMLRPVMERFPEDVSMRYDLACYACTTGNLKDAMSHLERAIDLAGTRDIRLKALDDPALEKLWVNISQI
jgi:predicted Zn-dependent protease